MYRYLGSPAGHGQSWLYNEEEAELAFFIEES